MRQGNALARCPFAALAAQLDRQAARPLAPRRRELRALAERLRAAAAAERAEDRRPA